LVKNDDEGGLRDDTSRRTERSKSSKMLLNEGGTVPKEALCQNNTKKKTKKPFEEKIRSRSRSLGMGVRFRSRSLSRGRTKQKTEKGDRKGAEEETDGLWDDTSRASRRSKNSKILLKEGETVPKKVLEKALSPSKPKKEIFQEKPSGEDHSPRSRSRSLSMRIRSKSRSRAPRKEKKNKSAKKETEEETSGLWDDASRASRSSKSSKVLLEEGKTVPKEVLEKAFAPSEPKKKLFREKASERDPATKSVESVNSRGSRKSRGSGVSRGSVEPSIKSFKSPMRILSPGSGKPKVTESSEHDTHEKGNIGEGKKHAKKETHAKKKYGIVRFRTPNSIRLRSLSRGKKEKNPAYPPALKNSSFVNKNEECPTNTDAFENTKGSSGPALESRRERGRTKERGMDPDGLVASKDDISVASFRSRASNRSRYSIKSSDKSNSSDKSKSSISIVSSNARTRNKSKSSVKSKSSAKSKSSTSTKSNSSADKSKASNTSSKKILRGYEEDNMSDSDVSFVEREIFALSEQLVSKGANWFNWNTSSKSYETYDREEQHDDEAMSKEVNDTSAWFTWNNDTRDDDETRHHEAREDMTLTGAEQQKHGWFDWSIAASMDEAEAIVKENNKEKGWFSQVSNYFADATLEGDAVASKKDDEDEEKKNNDSEEKANMRTS